MRKGKTMSKDQAQKLVDLIGMLISDMISESKADSGDSQAGMDTFRIKNLIIEHLVHIGT